MSTNRGQFASLPDGQRKIRVSDDGLSVTIWDENGTRHMALSFAGAPGSEELRRQWVACVASASGPNGSWRAIESTRAPSSRSREFLEWLSERGIENLDSLTADDWFDFVSWVRETHKEVAPRARNARLVAVRSLLLRHGALSDELGQALSQRYLETEKKTLPDHYTVSELQQIRSCANRALRTAWRRIEPHWALVQTPAGIRSSRTPPPMEGAPCSSPGAPQTFTQEGRSIPRPPRSVSQR